jgi:hypothetical protein
MRIVRVFWLPKRPVPPEGTPERVEYDAMQGATRWYPDSELWGVPFILLLWFLIVIASYLSSDPHSWGMLLLRVGATVILVGIAWREIIRQRGV